MGKKKVLLNQQKKEKKNKRDEYNHDTRTTFINLCKIDHKDTKNALTLERDNE